MSSEESPAGIFIHLKCKVETFTDVNTMGEESRKSVANKVVLTMGPRIKHCEVDIKEDGIMEISHTFKKLDEKDSYYNQMGYKGEPTDDMKAAGLCYNRPEDSKLKSKFIVWVYKTHNEDQIHPRGGGLQGQTPSNSSGHIVRRVYLIGTAVLDVEQVMNAVVSGQKCTFECRHNFTEHTYTRFTILQCEERDPCNNNQKKVSDSLKQFKDGIEEYRKELKSAQETNRPLDYSEFKYMDSVLANVPMVNATVTCQQGLLQGYCGMAVNAGQMVLADRTVGSFMACSTFGQLYGDALCFTDASDIVRKRGAEIPFQLVMMYVYCGIRVNGYKPLEVARMLTNRDAQKLLFVFKSILSCPLMDSKQSEYVSDYCLYSVEPATEFDMKVNRQPHPSLDPPDRLQEKWFYEKIGGKVVRYGLRLTEDQRQMCVGTDLDNKEIGDDCESSATFLMQVMKTMKALYTKVKLDIVPVLQKICSIPEEERKNARRVMQNVTGDGLQKVVDTVNGQTEDRKKIEELLDQAVPENFFGKEIEPRVVLLLSFINIMSQFEFELELTVGTANAAGVGMEEQLCGHCYTVLIAKHKPTGGCQKCIIEGTNWVFQERMGEEAGCMDLEELQMYNQIGAYLEEITKRGDVDLREDIGKAMVRMVEGDGNPFYRTIVAIGNKIQMLVRGDPAKPDHQIQYGVSANDVVTNSPKILEMPINYTLVAEHLKRDAGKDVNGFQLTEKVHEIGYEVGVPAWTRETWKNNILDFYSLCQDLVEPQPSLSTFMPENEVRIVFVHELYRKLEKEDCEKFQNVIISVLQKGNAPQVTAKHKQMAKKHFHAMNDQENLKYITSLPEIDVDKVNKYLTGVQNLVKVERIFTVMQNVVTVCRIRRCDLKSLHAMLSRWVKAISNAHSQRHKVIDDWIVSKASWDYYRNGPPAEGGGQNPGRAQSMARA